jgi:hypothetical protein
MIRLKIKVLGVETVSHHRSDKGWIGGLGGGLALVALQELIHHLNYKIDETAWRERQAQGPHQDPLTSPCRYGWGRAFSLPNTRDWDAFRPFCHLLTWGRAFSLPNTGDWNTFRPFCHLLMEQNLLSSRRRGWMNSQIDWNAIIVASACIWQLKVRGYGCEECWVIVDK